MRPKAVGHQNRSEKTRVRNAKRAGDVAGPHCTLVGRYLPLLTIAAY
jgi:hypothetical protein